MKENSMARRLILATLVAGLGTAAHAQYLNTFDSSVSPGRFDYGGGGAETNNSVAFSALNSGGGAPGSGSAQLNWTWNGVASGSAAFTFDTTFPATDFSGGTLSFDLRLDSSSTAGSFNDYGFFQVFVRNTGNYDGQDLGGGNGLITKVSALDTWTHIDIPLGTNGNALRAITFQDFNDVPGRAINGPIRINVDNLQIVPEPSSLALFGIGAALVGFLRRRK